MAESGIGIPRLAETGDKGASTKTNGSTELLYIRWNFCPGERGGTPSELSTVLKFGTTPKMRWRSSRFSTSSEVSLVLAGV
jgi:hypothetical protein